MHEAILTTLFVLTLSPILVDHAWERHVIDASSQGADGVRLADINGDGLLDIATAWEEGGLIRAYQHPGTDSVSSPWPAVTVGEVRSGEDAVFVDLDADGAMDVVSACEGQTKTLYVHWAPQDAEHRLRANAWKTEAFPSSIGHQMWMYVLPLQVDSAFGPDLLVAGKGNGAEIGWFRAPEHARDLAAWRYERIASMGWVMSIEATDMDNDGDLDVLYSDRRGPTRGIYWLEWQGSRWKRHALPDANRENMFLGTGDLDRDGRMDVVCATKGGPIMWYQRQDNPSWRVHEIAYPPGVGSGKSVAIADINGDEQPDLVFSCEHARGGLSGLRWLSHTGDPADGDWQSHEIAGSEGVKFDRLVPHDLDGDGDLDIITCEEATGLGVIWYENPHAPKR